MPVAGFAKCTADKANVVGGTTTASGLRDDNRKFICVIFAGQNRIHNLTDNNQRWIAGIVVYIF